MSLAGSASRSLRGASWSRSSIPSPTAAAAPSSSRSTPTCTNMRRGASATNPARSWSWTSPTATSWRCRRCPRSTPTISPTGSARMSGRCCPTTTICHSSTRSLESLYPSGSTIKPSMAHGAAQCRDRSASSASIAPAPTRSATTSSTATSGHGPVDMDAAVVHSCDIYFYDDVPPRRRRKARADGPLDGLRREVRPAVRQPALRHRARSRSG